MDEVDFLKEELARLRKENAFLKQKLNDLRQKCDSFGIGYDE